MLADGGDCGEKLGRGGGAGGVEPGLGLCERQSVACLLPGVTPGHQPTMLAQLSIIDCIVPTTHYLNASLSAVTAGTTSSMSDSK